MFNELINRLKNGKHFSEAILALILYRYPARHLEVIGVTGTDGKTTTVHLIDHLLKTANKKVAFISTVGAKIGKKEIDTGFHVTTPNPWQVQKILRQLVNQKIESVVLEATSHGLDQHRLLGCNFSIGVLTNITHEHLDYHQTFKKYLEAKAKLFRQVKMAILNHDDPNFNYLKKVAKGAKIVTYGIKKKADFNPRDFQFPLEGEHNQYNCLAAIATAASLGIEEKTIKKAIASFKPVKGRLEEIKEGQKFRVLIDFAHTPHSLSQILKTLRSQIKTPRGRLIVVFGSAGLRDVQKRPMMGEVAVKLADLAVLTAEDPRTEEVNEIIAQIAKGCQKSGGKEDKTYFRIPDRQEAISFAIKLAKAKDIVVICGKGHEKSMCFGKTEVPWSDQKAARKALKKMS